MEMTEAREDLQHHLKKDREPGSRLDQLLDSLTRQDADLQEQLDREQDPVKRRHLRIQLKIIRMQRSKVLDHRLELQGGQA
jgi:hypothetical protein